MDDFVKTYLQRDKICSSIFHTSWMLVYNTYVNTNIVRNIDLTNAEQVTSISQLSNVQPTDWVFQALQLQWSVTVILLVIKIAVIEVIARHCSMSLLRASMRV
jgi:hypothetical protein